VRDERPESNADDTFSLSGENESLRLSVVDLFPAANPKLVGKIITKDLDLSPFGDCGFARIAPPHTSHSPLLPLKTAKSAPVRMSTRISNVSRIGPMAIMLEIFKLPSLAAAQLRFYQEVVEANDIYDFSSSVIKFAIQWHHRARTNFLDPSMWWPVIPQWRDNWLRQPRLPGTKTERTVSSSPRSREVCYSNWKPGGCQTPRCERIHIPREVIERRLAAGRAQK
jgi:hypothetical protein